MRVKLFISSKKVILAMLILVFLVMSLFFPKEVFAGRGNIVGGIPNKLNLNLWLKYDASWADINAWKEAFSKASELLYNSTEGQMQIGTVNVYIGLQSPVTTFSTDLWVLDDDVVIDDDEEIGKTTKVLSLGGSGHILLHPKNKYILEEKGSIEDRYGLVWIPNTKSGDDKFFESEDEFPAFNTLVGKRTKLYSGKEVIWFDKDNETDDHFHWRYGDTGVWAKAGSSYNTFISRTGVRYNDHQSYIYCPNMGAPNYQYGFSNTQDIAVALMAINGKYVLYIARKNYEGQTIYNRFYTTQETPIELDGVIKVIPEWKGQVTIVHELGHYIFGLYDEYEGYVYIDGKWEKSDDDSPFPDCGKCTGDPNAPACLMDAGPVTNNDRTEWCTLVSSEEDWNTEHNPDCVEGNIENEQEHKNKKSCWETIVDKCFEKYGINLEVPTSEPSDVFPVDGYPYNEIEWNIIGGPWRAVIAIQKSKSMKEELVLANYGASIFTDYFHPGEELGVVSFSFFSPLPFISMPIHKLLTKEDVKKVINYLYATGGTNIGGALRESLEEIISDEEPLDTKFIVLFSDGKHTYGENPSSVIDELKDNGVKVFTVGFGDDVNEEMLRNIADETGGRYYFASSEVDFFGIFYSISFELRGSLNIDRIIGTITSSEQVTENVFVDRFSEGVKFMLEWEGSDLDLTLQRPDGTVVNPEVAETDTNIEYVEEETCEFYVIHEPMSGEWHVIIDAVDVTEEETYRLEVSGQSMGVLFNVYTDKDEYTYPESILIQAEVVAEDNVAGAEVTGTVERPDGSTVDITLYDDGLASHGDEFADDGFYSNYFSEYTGGGTYTFNMVVENTEGVQAYGQYEVPPEGWEPQPISPFRREASISVLLSKAETEIALDFPSNIQYSDMLSGKAALTSVDIILENMLVEFGCMLPTETLTTNASGEVHSTPYKVEETSGTSTSPVCVNFYGTSYYLPGYNEKFIEIEKENATLTYIGDTLVEVGTSTTLSCQVVQEDDGYPGDITYAGPVTFNITTLEGFDENYTASVGSDGIATVDIDLPVGLYTVVASIDSSYFTSSPSEETTITVYNP